MEQHTLWGISYKKIIYGIWAFFIFGLIIFFSLFYYVAKTKLPNTDELENPKFEQASIVYSSDGQEVDRYFSKNREWIQYEELSPYLIDALVGTEDHRFFHHSGIDSYSLARAIVFFGTNGGASTITQQLAKQFFTPVKSGNPVKRIWQKMKEWVIAIEFERRYTKEEIIAMFFNKFDFYYSSNGIVAASQVYFAKDQKDLTIDEAALLVGMFKNPYYYNPVKNPERAELRRNTVIAQMRNHEFISSEEYAVSKAQPIDMSNFKRKENYAGLAPHFMAELKKYVRELLLVKGINKPGGEIYNLDLDGLKIYSTIDSRYQRHAESVMKKHMSALQKQLVTSWGKTDLWDYNPDGINISSRKSILNNQVEASERYKQLRKKMLSDITNEISSNIEDVRLWNADIIRMIRAESNPKYLRELIDRSSISKKQKVVYETILDSPYWNRLKQAWNGLGTEAKRAFNTKRKMKLYSYNGEVESEMTPLDSIKYMMNFLQIGSVALDPHTGFVKSWVGGVDYEKWKYDHVTSNRQAGSTFKPFLYTTSIMNGISPCWKIEDIQYTIPAKDPNFGLSDSWSPKNARGTFSEEKVTLKEALRKSLNSASVWLVNELGTVEGIIQLAESMGIGKGKIGRYPSIVLGTPNVNVLEMTAAYSTFANNGISVKPVFVEKIEDKNGVVIYQSEVTQHRSIPENYNYAMVEMLKYAGSSVSYRLKTDFGGKTGTTNDHVDGWFMGITPDLVVGTWVGGEYPWIRFTNFDLGQGSYMARPYYLDYMTAIENDPEIGFKTNASFTFPGNLDIELDCSKYDDPLDNTEETNTEEFEDPF